jgi:hypothetical protein
MMTLLYFNRLWEALLDLKKNKEDILTRDEEDSNRIVGSKDDLNLITADLGSKEVSTIAVRLNSSKTL